MKEMDTILSYSIIVQEKLKRWANYLVYMIISLGLLVLLGWEFDIELLKRPILHLVAMNPATAVLFILLGFSFLFVLPDKNSKTIKRIGYVFIGIAFITTFLKLLSVFIDFNMAVDHILFSEKIDKEIINNVSNRMAPNTAFCFLLVSIALSFLSYRPSDKKIISCQVILLIVILIALLSVLGYMYHVPSFYGVLEHIPMAIHTAIGFLCISLAILFVNPDKGIMKGFTTIYSGSQMARFLIPAAIIIPSLLGFICLLGHRAELFSTEFGVAILILGIIIIFVSLIAYNSISLNKKDIQRKEAKIQLENNIWQLQENEEKFQKAFQGSAAGITITRLSDSTYVEVNNTFIQMTGYSKEELVGHTSSELGMIVNLKRREEILQQIKEHGSAKNFEMTVRSKSENIIEILSSVETILLRGEKHAINIIYDITDKKKAEDELKKSNMLFSNLFEYNPSSIAIFRISDTKMININNSFLHLFGFSNKEEVIGKKATELNIWYDPKQRDEIVRLLKKNDKALHLEGQVRTSQGEAKWASTSVIGIEIDEQPCLLAVTIDITKRKHTEEQLETVNKELEAFSYSISHDLRAPLRAVNGYAKILEDDYYKLFDEEGKRLLSTIQYNAVKMSRLIDDLLAFSRLGRKEILKTDLDMNKMIEDVLVELNKTTKHKTKIKSGILHSVKGDFTLINQVVFNLISNGIKYSSKKPDPFIEITSEVKDKEIIYTVKDNGDGFDMRYVDKLFGVFQRLHTSEEFEGVGVGLAIVKRIINKHGGKVWAESELGKSATFYFTLPIE
jgi:PAS domain S-box-containing protein